MISPGIVFGDVKAFFRRHLPFADAARGRFFLEKRKIAQGSTRAAANNESHWSLPVRGRMPSRGRKDLATGCFRAGHGCEADWAAWTPPFTE
jgi:hypothetical protein